MATAQLPDLPEGKEFEEFLAAFFQAHGLYVERNVVDRQEEEVLELDIITTDYTKGGVPDNKLFEVKSGSWGLSEVFKLRGWLDYLNLDSGCLLVRQQREALKFYQKIGSSLGIDIISIPDIAATAERLEPLLSSKGSDEIDIACWRFSYWVERALLRLLKIKKKSLPDKKCYPALDRYFSLINNRIFFTRNIIERAQLLYESYREYPHISAKLGHELEGKDFEREYEDVPSTLYRKTYYECELTDLAISTFVEHRARLAVLKSAIDYTIYKETRRDQDEQFVIKFGDRRIEVTLLNLLPQSFQEGLATIKSHRYYFRYPVFWQWFLWIFGGFILKDYEEREYGLLAEKTGIPKEEIPNAFASYEILFPGADGWFMDLSASNIRLMKLFPVPFLGIGANYRRLMYTDDGKWEHLELSGLHTRNDLIKWNNVTVELLTSR